jgi:hypothetical protein
MPQSVQEQVIPIRDDDQLCHAVERAITQRLYAQGYDPHQEDQPYPHVRVGRIEPQRQGPFFRAQVTATIEWYRLGAEEAKPLESHEVPTTVWFTKEMQIIKVVPRQT